jgi:hypothetical protein
MKIRLAAILLVALCVNASGTSGASQNRVMFLQSENIVQHVGDSLIVNLSLDSAVQLVHGYRVRFSFDTTILRLDNVTATSTWNAGGFNFFFYKDTLIVDTASHDTSLYDLGSYYLGRSLHINGYADIARFKFTALQTGATFLWFDYVLVQDTLLNLVTNQRSDAVIFVCPFPPGYIFYGDLTHDNKIDLSDLSLMIAYLVGSGATLSPITLVADWNCSGAVDLSDLSSMISYLVTTTPKPCNLCPPSGGD